MSRTIRATEATTLADSIFQIASMARCVSVDVTPTDDSTFFRSFANYERGAVLALRSAFDRNGISVRIRVSRREIPAQTSTPKRTGKHVSNVGLPPRIWIATAP